MKLMPKPINLISGQKYCIQTPDGSYFKGIFNNKNFRFEREGLHGTSFIDFELVKSWIQDQGLTIEKIDN